MKFNHWIKSNQKINTKCSKKVQKNATDIKLIYIEFYRN
jgi:hypothetical protein